MSRPVRVQLFAVRADLLQPCASQAISSPVSDSFLFHACLALILYPFLSAIALGQPGSSRLQSLCAPGHHLPPRHKAHAANKHKRDASDRSEAKSTCVSCVSRVSWMSGPRAKIEASPASPTSSPCLNHGCRNCPHHLKGQILTGVLAVGIRRHLLYPQNASPPCCVMHHTDHTKHRYPYPRKKIACSSNDDDGNPGVWMLRIPPAGHLFQGMGT